MSVLADVPALGDGLEIHLFVAITYGCQPEISLSNHLTGVGSYFAGHRWLLTGS